MAIAEMQKMRMAVHKSVADKLIDKIQRLGCCQFIPNSGEGVDGAAIIPLRQRLRKLDDQLAEARSVLRFLDPFATEKGGGMAKAFGDVPNYTLSELASIASADRFPRVVSETRVVEKKLSDTRADASRATGLIAQLSPLSGLPYPLDLYGRGTEKITGSLLSVNKSNVEPLKAGLFSSFGDMIEFHELPADEKAESRIVSILYPRESAEALQEIASSLQAVRIDVPQGLSATPGEELSVLEGELLEAKERESSTIKEITSVANEHYSLCQNCTDYWNIERAKIESLISGEQTEQITLLLFWIPASCLDRFKEAAAPFESLTEVARLTPEKDEMPPTLLYNRRFTEPMEPLITMYGTPTYGKMDPTAFTAPFFYMFFGICYGDAGYGLLIAAGLMFLLMRKNVEGAIKKFLEILIIGNIGAVIFGALTFSWFGDGITSFSFLNFLAPLEKLKILDPMNDPMTMLSVSLALGFIQIMFGLVLAFIGNVRSGETFAALADQGAWIVFLCGLVLGGLSAGGALGMPANIGWIIAGIGAVVLVATQGRSKPSILGKIFSGVLSLYNVTSYLGDILSYSRLLALGLGSAAIAMVVNMLTHMVSDAIPVVGVVLGIVIFIIGHVFGMAINILGAFIHSLRLQYVEFFGKFYESSGEDFAPLAISTQYVRISEGAKAP
ncbi:MAG: V-type ATP synthase subunit I [Synergistaceae bacterium]|jgi:V/A-type H+-transporting ATPase subunit I|nr:V-type ATP synthase subunit I [Synergistaceae bacterium]